MQADIKVLGKDTVLEILPERIQNSHKGTFGKVLNIAGSVRYSGAAYLSSVSALKVGAGLSILATCSDVISSVSSQTPDITYIELGQSDFGTIPKDGIKYIDMADGYEAVSIGCGLGMSGGVSEFILSFLKKNQHSLTPIIIDADAINIIAKARNITLPLKTVLTPHPMELARLLKISVEEIEKNRAKYAWEASKKYDCTVVLKGHETTIASPDGKIYINHTGNSALAKGGTGDVLTGMIAGFCAQGMEKEDASCAAVFIHGVAGEAASRNLTEYGVLASDLIKYIPTAMKLIANAG